MNIKIKNKDIPINIKVRFRFCLLLDSYKFEENLSEYDNSFLRVNELSSVQGIIGKLLLGKPIVELEFMFFGTSNSRVLVSRKKLDNFL